MIEKILNSKPLERARRFLGKKTGVYLKLKRFTASSSDELRTVMLLDLMGINCVIDVGANSGQFAESLYDFGYQHTVISFEPVKSVHEQLQKRAMKYDKWVVAEPCAIGDANGTSTINVSDATVFSSLLDIKKAYVESTQKSQVVSSEEINVFRLDTIIGKYLDVSADKRILLKIDTQGYEKQVLDGAPELLKSLVGLKIEIPLTPIYDGVAYTFYDIIDFMKENGYVPYSFNNEGVNLKTGRLNTIDGLFFKPG